MTQAPARLATMSAASCSKCGAGIGEADGWRASGPAGSAAFCRLEHVFPWALKGERWEAEADAPAESEEEGGPETCSSCGADLGPDRVTLVRHRGEHRIPDAFCSTDHMAAWAKAGGRWAR